MEWLNEFINELKGLSKLKWKHFKVGMIMGTTILSLLALWGLLMIYSSATWFLILFIPILIIGNSAISASTKISVKILRDE